MPRTFPSPVLGACMLAAGLLVAGGCSGPGPRPAAVGASPAGPSPDAAGTADAAPAPPAPGVPLGVDFRLSEGGTATVAGEGLTVTFSHVLTDSRCPRGVQCIWAGEVRIAVTLRQGGDAATIDLGDTLPPVGYRAYLIRLVAVDPYPVSGAEGGPRSAVLRVDKP